MAANLTVKINSVGKYAKGANVGKDYISFFMNKQIHSIRVTEAMAAKAQGKSFMYIQKLEDSDNYPVGKEDSKTTDSSGNPVYKAGEKLTVAEYWKRRKAIDESVTPMVLFQFVDFPSAAEEQVFAQLRMQKYTLAE